MAKKSDSPHLSVVGAETSGPRLPRQLGQHGSALWHQIQGQYGIADAGGVELLTQICEATDRLQGLSAAIARDGATVYSRAGVPRTHPSVKDETALRCFITRTVERLGLNVEAIKAPGRPATGSGWIPDHLK
jgi:hypothetical protein